MPSRPLLLSCLLATLSLGITATTQAQACAEVEVQNVRPTQGYLMVAAYADADSYGKKAVSSLRIAAGETVMKFQLCGLNGAQAALMLYQDLDGDGRMARNPIGVPSEPWGSSGKPGSFGPSWDTGRVALDGAPIVVRMSQ